MAEKITAALKKDKTLLISGVCAAVSVLFSPPSKEYIGYIDVRVICLLFCLMAVVAGLEELGVFQAAAGKFVSGERKMRVIYLTLVLLPFFMSMVITNDVALITFVPFAVLILKMAGEEKYLEFVVVMQTVAANLGSMATPIGNPQNLYLYSKFEIPAASFFKTILPFVVLSLLLICLCMFFAGNRSVKIDIKNSGFKSSVNLYVLAVLALLCLLSVFRALPYYWLTAIVVLSLLIFMRSVFKKIDYGLLATFVFFFIFAGNIGKNDYINALITDVLGKNAVFTAVVSSQFISNVPSAVLLSEFTDNWAALLVGSNIGGLGTPVASLASLISLKIYMNEGYGIKKYMAVFLAVNFIFLFILYIFSKVLV